MTEDNNLESVCVQGEMNLRVFLSDGSFRTIRATDTDTSAHIAAAVARKLPVRDCWVPALFQITPKVWIKSSDGGIGRVIGLCDENGAPARFCNQPSRYRSTRARANPKRDRSALSTPASWRCGNYVVIHDTARYACVCVWVGVLRQSCLAHIWNVCSHVTADDGMTHS